MVRVVSTVALAASALAFAAGCAGGDAAPVTAPGAAEQLLTGGDVREHPEGSPARALLEWWRAAQFQDAAGVKAGMARAVRAELEGADDEQEVLIYFGGAIRAGRPTILSVDREGRQAVVYTHILFRQPVGTQRYVVFSTPRAFRLVRENARWVLADDSFMQSVLPEPLRRSRGA